MASLPTYDPELNLMYITTGNPTPSFNGLGREGREDLYTCSLARDKSGHRQNRLVLPDFAGTIPTIGIQRRRPS